MCSLNRLRFHYEYIVRQDLLLKCNYNNIFEVPRVCKMLIVSRVFNESKHVPLVLEVISGQKAIQIEASNLSASRKHKMLSFRAKAGAKQSDYSVRICLRAEMLYIFCDKLMTILSSHDYTATVQGNTIQLTIDSNMLRLFPEVQNHFELFEGAHESERSVQVIIVTSSHNEQETLLFWTGLNQKQIQ